MYSDIVVFLLDGEFLSQRTRLASSTCDEAVVTVPIFCRNSFGFYYCNIDSLIL